MNGLGRGALVMGLVGSMLAQSACYDWEMVKPAEVPKLSGSFQTPVGPIAGGGTLVAIRVVDVEREDGTLAQIKGNFDLKVVLKSGEEVTFNTPMEAERQGDELVVRGGNR